MSFSFGFNDDDIDMEVDGEISSGNQSKSTIVEFKNPLNQPLNGIKPAKFSLSEILSSLLNVPITFSEVAKGVYKRELFDVKHQLMLEDDNEFNENIEETLMGSDDLKKFIYEGGLKTWECSVDLIDHLSNLHKSDYNNFEQIIELGSGTSIPSCYLFKEYLKMEKSIDLVVSDYNKSVLRLVTVPNLIINWFMTLSVERKQQLKETFKINANIDEELQISEKLIENFLNDLKELNINVELINGSWSKEFLNLLNVTEKSLILTSETIYSPETMPILSEIIIELCENNSDCLVAAKDIYFGVGGTVLEFLNYLDGRIEKNKVKIVYDVKKISNGGLNRSIITINTK